MNRDLGPLRPGLLDIPAADAERRRSFRGAQCREHSADVGRRPLRPRAFVPENAGSAGLADIAPRFGLAYDLFGNAKTALKFSLNRYNDSRTTGIAAMYNPLALATARLTWRDVNGDDIAQGELGCVYLTAGCEIDLAQMPANFGIRSLRTYDPDTDRPYNVLSNIGIQHQLLPRLSVSASLVKNQVLPAAVPRQRARTRADYTPVKVVSPLDGELITVYNLNRRSSPRCPRSTRPRLPIGSRSSPATRSRSTPACLVARRSLAERRPTRTSTVTCDDPDNPTTIATAINATPACRTGRS